MKQQVRRKRGIGNKLILRDATPTFSIIIPLYKTEVFLEQTLDAIMDQTYDDFEVIIISDQSPGVPLDDPAWKRDTYRNKHIPSKRVKQENQCKWIINRYKDSRISYIEQKNAMAGFARNNGIDHATGTYLVFLDSDDLIPKDYLEIAYDHLQHKAEDEIIFAGMRMYDSGTGSVYPYPHHVLVAPWPNTLKTLLVFPNWATTPVNYFWERTFFEKHRIRYPIPRLGEDFSIVLEALKYWNGSMEFTPIPTYQLYRSHSMQQPKKGKSHQEKLMHSYVDLGHRHIDWISKLGWVEYLLVRLFIMRSKIYIRKMHSNSLHFFILNLLSKALTGCSLILSGGRFLKRDEDLFKPI